MEDEVLWLSLGLKPELTGLGLGEEFVSECVKFARLQYKLDKQPIRLEVALFNQRDIRVYKKVGFRLFGKVNKNTNGYFAWNLFFQKRQQDITIDGVNISVENVTPEEIRSRVE